MTDQNKTKAELINELVALRQQVADWQAASNIAGHKLEQTTLPESETRYQTLINQAPNGIFVTDAHGQYVDVNLQGCAMLGYSRREILQMKLSDLIPTQDMAANPLVLDELPAGKIIIDEWRFKQKNGNLLPVEICAKKLTDGRFQAIVQDITRRKQTETELQYRMKLGRLISSLSTHFINLPLDRIASGINQALQTIAEFTGSDRSFICLFSKNITTMSNIHEWCAPDIPPLIDTFKNIPLDRYPWTVGKLKQLEPVLISDVKNLPEAALVEQAAVLELGVQSLVYVPLVLQEQAIGFLGFDAVRTAKTWSEEELALLKIVGEMFVNTLARQRAEATLRKAYAELETRVEERTTELSTTNAQLGRAIRTKDEFLATMSHELRTPLNAILGMTEVLHADTYGPLNEKQDRAVSHIETSGRHLLTLITDILDLSKIEAGKMELDNQPIAVDTLCQNSLALVMPLARQKKIKIFSSFENVLYPLLADGLRLKQILVNLLDNALKFTPEKGQVGLDVSGNVQQDIMQFTIWDTGIGIKQADMNRLFKPFVQVDGALNRQYEGTGLGLALVYRLVEMHNGSISVESDVGRGSRFIVRFPWVQTKAEAVSEPEPDHTALGSEGEQRQPIPTPNLASGFQHLVLLAEDNEANIVTVQDFLTARNYRVVVARNGHEALRRAREEPPDIILMDIQMPAMDGLEATRQLRADKKLAHTPVVALTALAMPGDRERCLAAGVDEYLCKPVRLANLLKVIEQQVTAKHRKEA